MEKNSLHNSTDSGQHVCLTNQTGELMTCWQNISRLGAMVCTTTGADTMEDFTATRPKLDGSGSDSSRLSARLWKHSLQEGFVRLRNPARLR